ncbi:MAG: serine/threonine protein kinase [Candidatus Eisenbacteria bacterium]|nr:serine/threonine protein kinase [Candidatus Eisenbacteria bacterium]
MGGFGIPERIESYRLLHSIASGGMGDVFLAVDERTDERVALKVIRPIFSTPSGAARFRREVELHAKLDHPGIVPYIAAGRWNGPLGELQYLVTRFIEGVDLLTYAAREELGERERLGLIIAVCAAMEHAHGRGVAHRDLKPENILVDRSGVPRILDFGLAATIGSAARDVSRITNEGELIGTVRYMSPEALADRRDASGQTSDIYTIGVLLFELLTGRVPYDVPEHPTFVSYFRAIALEEPRRLSEVLAPSGATGHPLDPVLARCLAYEPQDRYARCAELGADLERYLRGESPAATLPPVRPGRINLASRAGTRGWRRAPLLVAFAISLLAVTVALVTVYPRIRAARVLKHAVATLSRAQVALHHTAYTDSTLDRTVTELGDLLTDLRSIGKRRFFGHLLRFTYWRLGEAYYFRAMSHDDLEALEDCRRSWEAACNCSFDVEIAEFIPRDATFRASILEDPQHVAYSGVAGCRMALAEFQSPVTQLSIAADGLQYALEVATGPFHPNYTLGVDSTNALHQPALVQHDYGASLTRLGVALDSLGLVLEGLESLKSAGRNPDYFRLREAYAAYLVDRGMTYTRVAELSRRAAPLDSAFRCYQEAIAYQDEVVGRARPKTRLSIARSHLIAARLTSGARQTEHTESAWSILDGARADLRRSRPLLRLDHALLEAELRLDLAERAVPAVPFAQHLAAATLALERADSVVVEVPYPVPTARVALSHARLAALSFRRDSGAASLRAARDAISQTRQLVGQDDWPSFHRKLREVEAMLEE